SSPTSTLFPYTTLFRSLPVAEDLKRSLQPVRAAHILYRHRAAVVTDGRYPIVDVDPVHYTDLHNIPIHRFIQVINFPGPLEQCIGLSEARNESAGLPAVRLRFIHQQHGFIYRETISREP